MSDRMWLLALGGPVVVVAAILALALTLLLTDAGSRPGEVTAKFMPPDTSAYLSFNLRPGMGQRKMGSEALSLLETDGFIEARDDLLEAAEEETGVHFLDDIEPWLGTDITLALFDGDDKALPWAALVQVADRDAAFGFVEDLAAYLEDEAEAKVGRRARMGADLWVWEQEEESLAVGLTDDYLIAGDSEDRVADMVRALASPPAVSLAQDPDFAKAQESLPAERVMFLFARTDWGWDDLQGVADDFGAQSGLEGITDGFGAQSALEGITEGLGDQSGLEGITEGLDLQSMLEGVADEIPAYLAASMSFIDKGMRLDMVLDTPSGAWDFDLGSGLRSPQALPDDTLLLLAGGGLTEVWGQGQESSQQEELLGAMTELLEGLTEGSGIDVEQDIFNSLTGEVALALLPSSIRLAQDWTPTGALEAVLLMGVREPGGIERALDKALGLMTEDSAIEVDRVPLNGYQAVTLPLDDADIPLVDRPGYVVTDDWVVVGSTFDSLERSHQAASGSTGSLRSSAEFAKLADTLPDPLHFLAYADIAGLAENIEEALPSDQRADYDEALRYLDPFSALLLAISATDEATRLTMGLSLRDP